MPISPPAAAPAGRRRSWAIPISLLAVLIAAGAAVLSWRALDQADDARDIALRGGAPAPTAGPSPAPVPTTGAPQPPQPSGATAFPSVDPTGALPALSAQTVYDEAYPDTQLEVQGSCNARYIDLDQPQVDAQANFEVALDGPCGRGGNAALQLAEQTRASVAPNTAITAPECWDRLRLSPAGPAAKIPVRQGQVVCIWTSLNDARDRGDLSRLVLLEVRSLASDNTVTMRVKAWKVPL